MLRETPPESLESINEESRKSHILGLKSEVWVNPFVSFAIMLW
jgi:hypothetical protein